MNYDQQMKEIKRLLKEGEYDFAEAKLLALINESKFTQVIDETVTHYCCKNYIELNLVALYYGLEKENICPDIDYAEIYKNLAFINVKKSNFGMAAEYLKLGLKWNPAAVELIFDLADVYKILGEIDNFLMALGLAYNYIYSSAYLARYYRELGWYYIQIRELGIAGALYTHSVGFEDSKEALDALVYIAEEQGDKTKNKVMSNRSIRALLKELGLPIGFNENVLKTVAQEYMDWKQTSTKTNNFKFTSRVLYDMTMDKKYMLYVTLKDEEKGLSLVIPETWSYVRKSNYAKFDVSENVAFKFKSPVGDEIEVVAMTDAKEEKLEEYVDCLVNVLKERGHKVLTVDKIIGEKKLIQIVFDTNFEGVVIRTVDTYVVVNNMLLSTKWNVPGNKSIKEIYSDDIYSWYMDIVKSIRKI